MNFHVHIHVYVYLCGFQQSFCCIISLSPFGCRRGHDFTRSKLQVLYVVEHRPFPETEQFVVESVKRSAHFFDKDTALLSVALLNSCMPASGALSFPGILLDSVCHYRNFILY